MTNWFARLHSDGRLLSLSIWERWLCVEIHEQCEQAGGEVYFDWTTAPQRLLLGVSAAEVRHSITVMCQLRLLLCIDNGEHVLGGMILRPYKKIDGRAGNGASAERMAEVTKARLGVKQEPAPVNDPTRSVESVTKPSSSLVPSSSSLVLSSSSSFNPSSSSSEASASEIPRGRKTRPGKDEGRGQFALTSPSKLARATGFGIVKEHWMIMFKSETGNDYYWQAKDSVALNNLLGAEPKTEAAKLVIGRFVGRYRRDPFWRNRGLSMTLVGASLNELRSASEAKTVGPVLKVGGKDDFKEGGRVDL